MAGQGAAKLNDWIQRHGVGAAELARRTGVSRQAVDNWRKGQPPKGQHAVLLELATSYVDPAGSEFTEPVRAADWGREIENDANTRDRLGAVHARIRARGQRVGVRAALARVQEAAGEERRRLEPIRDTLIQLLAEAVHVLHSGRQAGTAEVSHGAEATTRQWRAYADNLPRILEEEEALNSIVEADIAGSPGGHPLATRTQDPDTPNDER